MGIIDVGEVMARDSGLSDADIARRIGGLTADSRQVEPGWLFAALPGTRADGRDFVPEALARGARMILAPPGFALPQAAGEVTLITDPSPRRRYARLAARLFEPQPAFIAAVTGTNGKTSTVNLLRQLWRREGRRAASLGTLGLTVDDRHQPGALTTPDPVSLHRSLADLATRGVDHLALEASSHGLDQGRLEGVRLTCAIFTNLSRDHLDYHRTEAAYYAAKARLFTELLPADGVPIIHTGSAAGRRLADEVVATGRHPVTVGGPVGEPGEDTVEIMACRAVPAGIELTFRLDGTRHSVTVPLIGRFQIDNALLALAAARASGVAAERLVAGLTRLHGVRGRLEHVATLGTGGTVYVDYAHTPAALKVMLGAVRPHVAGRLIVVVGAGGDRDPGKRPLMGRAAATGADIAIITDDNPRTEDPATIRRQVLAGCPAGREVGDRAEAIAEAMALMAAGDVLVVAGKGHEPGQTVGHEVRPFDDAQQVRRIAGLLPERGGMG